MDAWLKAHAFFETAVCAAIYLEGGDCHRLSRDRSVLRLLVDGVCEDFKRACARISASPVLAQSAIQLDAAVSCCVVLGPILLDPDCGLCLRPPCQGGSGETQALANDCRALLDKSGVEAPALVQLYRAIDHL